METKIQYSKNYKAHLFVYSKFTIEDDISLDERFINKVKAFIEFNINNPDLGVSTLSCEMGMCRSQLYRKLKNLTGFSPSVYVRLYRLEKAYFLIERGFGNVSEVAYKTGFENLSYFTKCFAENFKLLPSELKIKAKSILPKLVKYNKTTGQE